MSKVALDKSMVADDASGSQNHQLPANVVWLSIASLFNDMSGEIVVRALPLFLVGTLGVSKTVIGAIEGISDSTASLLKIVSGWYSDRWGSRKGVATAGYSLTAIARPLLLIGGVWWPALISRFVDRLGKGIRTAPRDALIADSVAASNRGRAFGLNRAMDPLGAVLGALMAALVLYLAEGNAGQPGLVITAGTFRTLVLIATVPTFLSVLVIVVFVHEKRERSATPPPFSSLLHVGVDKRFRRLMLVVGLFALGSSSDAFLLLRAQALGVTPVTIFLLVAAFNMVTTLSAYPAGILSDRLSRKTIIRIGWLFYAGIYFCFAYATSAWQVGALFIGYGLFYGLTEGVEKAFVADLVTPEERGAAFGLYTGVVGLVILPASLIAGWLWQHVGIEAPFVFGGALALFAAILIGFIPEKPAAA